MKKDKIKICLLQIIYIIFLACTLFFRKSFNNRIIISSMLLLFSIIIYFVVRKKTTISINRKKATKLIILLAIIYLALYYTFGIYSGYYKATHQFTFYTIRKFIIPLSIIIVLSEYLRNKFLVIDTKLSNILNFILCVLIDVLVYSNIYGISNLDEFLVSIGYLLFSSISCNLLYNYISRRYGAKPVIIYRLVTTLYLYIIPITPDIYIFFKSFFRIIYPLLVYYILEDKFGINENIVTKKYGVFNIFNIIFIIFLIIFVMLISCKFRFGLLVIGSGSMTGTIDKGDVILYDSYTKDIDVDDIAVFYKDSIRLVHRVIGVEYINNKRVYYTKGDNNLSKDEGFIDDTNIIGRVRFKIVKIGKPTIWLHEIFES